MSSTKKQKEKKEPKWLENDDGYFYVEGDTDTLFFVGTDGVYYPCIKILDMTGTLNGKLRSKLLRYLTDCGNTFQKSATEWVSFERAVVTDALHISTALSDPYSNQNIRHMTVQLSNRELDHDDYSTHLLHFRPSKPELSYFYPVSKTRTQVTAMQNKKFKQKSKDRKDPPGGGAGGSGSSKHSNTSGGSKHSSGKKSGTSGSNTGSGSKSYTSGRHRAADYVCKDDVHDDRFDTQKPSSTAMLLGLDWDMVKTLLFQGVNSWPASLKLGEAPKAESYQTWPMQARRMAHAA